MIGKKTYQKSKHVFTVGTALGVLLSVITLVIQCVAFSTPHWKEISSNTVSLYVDGVDALIRTEVLHYFNSVHRSTRHSYGLFQRCEYVFANASLSNSVRDDLLSSSAGREQRKSCTNNALPAYRDEHFNECHSLPYYRFCTKASEKTFDFNQDYLRRKDSFSSSSCECQSPAYVMACRFIGVVALLCLLITSICFSLFLCVVNVHHRLKVKCFGVLFSILASLFMLINLLIISRHSSYELIEYLVAIERHYKLNQIYKLSQDTKTAIDRFLSSIEIEIGYSAVLGWIAFVLSIIDSIFFMATCKINHQKNQRDVVVESKILVDDDEHRTPLSPLPFQGVSSYNRSLPPPAPPPLSQRENFHEHDETYSFPTSSNHQRKYQSSHIDLGDEV